MSNQKSAVIGRAKLGNKPNQNAFDLSHRNCFTTSCGVLMPVQYAEVLPGEKFSISESHFTRAQDLLSNSYGRFVESVQSFFVPYSSIFRTYSMRVLNTTQQNLAGYNENRISDGVDAGSNFLNTKLPSLALSDVVRVCLLIDSIVNACSRLKFDVVNSKILLVMPSGLLRSQAIARHMMALGYGDWTWLFPNAQNHPSHMNFNQVNLAFKHPEFGSVKSQPYFVLDWNASSDSINDVINDFAYIVSPMRLFAYHKIFNDFYRNDAWQPYQSNTCNLDFLGGTNGTRVVIPWLPSVEDDEAFFQTCKEIATTKEFKTIAELESYVSDYIITRHHAESILYNISFFDERELNLPLDAVNGVLPSPQYGSAAQVNIKHLTPSSPISGNSGVVMADLNQNSDQDNPEYDLKVLSGSDHLGATLDFDVKDLRIAQSLQKFKEISASRENYFVDQINAHFGYEYTKDPFVTKFLGGQSNTIQVDTQVNTNLAQETAVLGGIASAQGQYNCNGVADDYGLVITLHGIYPIVDYPNVGLDSQVLSVDGKDIPVPEFDNNGFEGRRLINVLGNRQYRYFNGTSPSDVYGYASRYFDYKTSKDVINGAFLTTMTDKVMAINRMNDYTIGFMNRVLLATPFLCDSVFANQEHGNIDDDQFYTNMNCGLSIVRPFSVHSLPYAN